MKKLNPNKTAPYVQFEPRLGTYEFGLVRYRTGSRQQLGVTFSFEDAMKKLAQAGVDFSAYDNLIKATRPAAPRGSTQ